MTPQPFSEYFSFLIFWTGIFRGRHMDSDTYCSTQCTGRFMCDEDQSWASFLVAGRIFGNVGG